MALSEQGREVRDKQEKRKTDAITRHKWRIEALRKIADELGIEYDVLLRPEIASNKSVFFTCKRCGMEWTQHDFVWDYRYGRAKLTSTCKYCHNERNKALREQCKSIAYKAPEHGEKVCVKCYKEYPVGGFYRSNTNKDGLRNVCIACERKYRKKYLLKLRDDPEKYEEYRKKQREYKRLKPRVRKFYEVKTGIYSCSNCGKRKAWVDFSRNAKNLNGLEGVCKECCRMKRRARYKNTKESKIPMTQQQRTWAKTELVSSAYTRDYNIFTGE